MDVHEAIRGRLSVREFKPDPVPDAVVRRVLLAARWAPSQRNRQPWRLVVVQDRDTLKKIGALASTGPYIANAAFAIALAMDAGAKAIQLDAGQAIQNMALAAWAEGLGACYVGGIDREAVKQLLGIPAEQELITVMPFGYPTDKALAGGKRRRPLEEIAFRERYGQPWR